jgi:small-conductance mechanosensitive channel
MTQLFPVGGYEEQILIIGLTVVVDLLLSLGIYLWIRRYLRSWANRTARPLDKQVVAISEYFLFPIIALGILYLFFPFKPVPARLEEIGQKAALGAMFALVLWLGARLALVLLDRLGEHYNFVRMLARRQRAPIWVSIAAALFAVAIHFLAPKEPALLVLPKIVLILAVAWILMVGVASAADMARELQVKRLEDVDVSRARSLDTLIGVLTRVANFAVVLIAIVAALNQFDFFQTLARSLLASAGIAGLVLGLAAQRTLGNVFAGVQLALTQPVSIGDSVVFEGEWGWIEEILLTYVVIRTWDLRRLVVPINYLLDHPIQNWTKTSPDLIGTVYIYTDYRIDVEAVRQELGRILESTPFWNRKVPAVLHTTDCRHDTVELRALCSASSAPVAWDLRCFVREKLLTYIQQIDNGRFLPRTRVEFERQAIASA